MCYAPPMRFLQVMVSAGAAFAFDRWQASDPLPTAQSWLLCVLVIGASAAWLVTVIIVRLSDAGRYWRRPRRSARPVQ